jgi:hypothetical protein
VDTRIQYSILGALSDDYEDFETTFAEAGASALTYGFSLSRQETHEALAELTKSGLVQAYLLSPYPPHAQEVDFDLNRIHELWFYVTPEGKRFVENMDQHP